MGWERPRLSFTYNMSTSRWVSVFSDTQMHRKLEIPSEGLRFLANSVGAQVDDLAMAGINTIERATKSTGWAYQDWQRLS